jgi:hypothetical protein
MCDECYKMYVTVTLTEEVAYVRDMQSLVKAASLPPDKTHYLLSSATVLLLQAYQ